VNNSLLQEAKTLPFAEQIQLAQELWENLIDRGFEPDLTPEQSAELDRRIQEHQRNPDHVIPWEEVKADFDRKYGKLR